MSSLFTTSIKALKGIGEKRAELLKRLGVESIGALLYYFPRAYEDWSAPVPIADAALGDYTCIRARLDGGVREQRISGGRLLSKATIYDNSSYITITFFNNRFIKDTLNDGEEYLFYGKLTEKAGRREMLSPAFLKGKESPKMHPIYNLTAGITSRQIEPAVEAAIKLLPEEIKDPLSDDIRKRYNLCGLRSAIVNIHLPHDRNALQAAKRRLIFEELLVLNLGLKQIKTVNAEVSSVRLNKSYSEEFFSLLPFEPTAAQKKAVFDCENDMLYLKRPMNRLIQGDVGSGKTAVAAAVCYTGVKNGWQAAFMAPTEILAEQHFNSISEILKNTDISVELLTGAVTAANKRKIKERLANGEIDIIIGTHALISDGVEFKNLCLVVTDEQHRFGVAQRAKLLAKGNNPHLMVMSATPIPRTLALMIYGDLDISVLNELPKGRQAIDTYCINSSKKLRAYNFLKNQIDLGGQCYIVCPVVEEGELPLTAVKQYSEQLQNTVFKSYSVGLLHGKMKAAEKERIMREFTAGDIHILVSTTVIEVGVDVPNAVVIMIENAERFGLSQLHQLRGRVGRGSKKSYCILVSDSRSDESIQRLSTMCRTSNGFEIADEDLKLRGPGDFFGAKQHGLPELKIADLADMNYLRMAQQAAQEILIKDPDLSQECNRLLRGEIARLFGKTGYQLN